MIDIGRLAGAGIAKDADGCPARRPSSPNFGTKLWFAGIVEGDNEEEDDED